MGQNKTPLRRGFVFLLIEISEIRDETPFIPARPEGSPLGERYAYSALRMLEFYKSLFPYKFCCIKLVRPQHRGADVWNWRRYMRVALNIIGFMLTLVGAVWFFQGINVLPGSFMTGQTQWAIYGGLTFLVGVIVLYLARRTRRP